VKAWKITPPRGEPKLPVNIYIDAKSYHQVSGAPGGALAYFRFVKPWDLDTYYERLDPDYSKQVLYHEANHYLQLLVDTHFAVPHFPGESMAEYYGASRWDPVTKKFETGLIQEGRLCEIQTDIAGGDKVTLETLITTDGMYQHYTWGWALVHFLMNDSRYAAKFQKFFLALSGGKGILRQDLGRDNLRTVKQADVWKVFQDEMGLKDANAVRKLETEWYDHIDKLGLVTESGLAKAGFTAAETGRVIRARRLFQEAIDKGSKNPLLFERYAELLDEKGDTGEARAMLEKAIELDPLEGKFYNRLGHRLLLHKDPEGDRWVALATELGFDDDWIDPDELDPKKKKEKEKGN
jgi:tetratricopeptide (TPR) repeat protein